MRSRLLVLGALFFAVSAPLSALALPQEVWLPSQALTPRHTEIAHDPVSGEILMFGGDVNSPASYASDTWRWDGSGWSLLDPAVSPPVTSGVCAMATDTLRGRVLMVPANLDETWEWNGYDWRLLDAGNGPPPRRGHRMVYDSIRDRVVLFGGINRNDTWEWNGSAWTRVATPDSPAPRWSFSMAFDPGRGMVVMYGGLGTTWFDETWEYDGTTWVQKSPAFSVGNPYQVKIAGFDPQRGKLVMVIANGMVEWNGTDWLIFWANFGTPFPAASAAFAYESGSGHLLALERSGATWEWDGADWTERVPAATPPRRTRHAMVTDRTRGSIFLFGGRESTGAGQPEMSDTWEWDGLRWLEHQPAVSPADRYEHAVAVDESRQCVVLFGGGKSGGTIYGDTWEWDGAEWTQRFPATSPSPRRRHAMAWDGNRGKVLLFGGRSSGLTLGDSWEWDGSNWTSLSPATRPSPRYDHSMVFDESRQRVVLVGGDSSAVSDTWEWSGNSWDLVAAAGPRPDDIAHDDVRGRTICMASGVTWEWDGHVWQAVQSIPSGSRSGHRVAFDPVSERTMMFGGGINNVVDDPWFYGAQSPAAQATYGTPSTGSNGSPVIAAGVPYLNNAHFSIDLAEAHPSSNGLVGLSALSHNLPLQGDCTLYVRAPVSWVGVVTNPAGFASVPVPLPAYNWLRGITIFTQGFVQDPAGPFAGFACTQGVELVIGD